MYRCFKISVHSLSLSITPFFPLSSLHRRHSLAWVGRLDNRPMAERAGATILGWNVSGTTGVAARDNWATTNEATRADEEVGCGVANDVMEWGGIDTTTACNAAVIGRDAAPVRCLIGWRHTMVGRPRTRPGRSIHFWAEGAVCSPWWCVLIVTCF